MKSYEQADFYRPTKRQLEFAGKLAREIRDRLIAMGETAPSAHSLSKYYTIDTLQEALSELKASRKIKFE